MVQGWFESQMTLCESIRNDTENTDPNSQLGLMEHALESHSQLAGIGLCMQYAFDPATQELPPKRPRTEESDHEIADKIKRVRLEKPEITPVECVQVLQLEDGNHGEDT